jgi:hypothetical protein
MDPDALRELPALLSSTLQRGNFIAAQLLRARRSLLIPYRQVIAKAQAQLGMQP